MSLQFRAFATLLHRRDPAHRDGVLTVGCLVAALAAGALGVLFVVSRTMCLLVAAVVVPILAFALSARPKKGPNRGEVFDNLLRELALFEQSGMLEQRVHPGLSVLLERAAGAVLEIEALSKELKDQDLARRCAKVAQDALWDAVWAGRHMVRRKGHRTKTFEQRCADPAFGATALNAVEGIVSEIEALRQGLRPEGMEKAAGLTELQLALQSLSEHVEADREARLTAGLES